MSDREANIAMLCQLTTVWPREIWLAFDGIRYGHSKYEIHMRENEEKFGRWRVPAADFGLFRWEVGSLHHNMDNPACAALVAHLREWLSRCPVSGRNNATVLCSWKCGAKMQFDPRRTDMAPVCDACRANPNPTVDRICRECDAVFQVHPEHCGRKCESCRSAKVRAWLEPLVEKEGGRCN